MPQSPASCRFAAAIALALLALPAKADSVEMNVAVRAFDAVKEAANEANVAAAAADDHVFRAAELVETATGAATAAYADEAMIQASYAIAYAIAAADRAAEAADRAAEAAPRATAAAAEAERANPATVAARRARTLADGAAVATARAAAATTRAAAAAARAVRLRAANADEFDRLATVATTR